MKAIVIGATGLVGLQLVQLLLKDNRFTEVVIFVRKPTKMVHAKLKEHVVNFDNPTAWKYLVTGDVLFSAMGTTLRKAGSKEAQYKVDYTYQYEVAAVAAANGVPIYTLVSAAGSDPSSKLFYSKMKGELEMTIEKLPFKSTTIIRPGMLSGPRQETRIGELIGIAIMKVISILPGLHNLKPISGKKVAKAMINAATDQNVGIHKYTLGDVYKLAGYNQPDFEMSKAV
jgi:uncharacterized protein YbjT (DUF2867 family)